jgi:hypothetical protein
MVGANAATGNANAAMGNGMAAELRHGLVEQLVRRYREQAGRSHADQLARMTWTDEARCQHADPGGSSRDAGSTPLRWTRLT